MPVGKSHFLCAVIALCLALSQQGFAQCSSSVKLIKTTRPTAQGHDGKIEVKVVTNGTFKLQLFYFSFSEGENKLIQTLNESSSKTITLSDLSFDIPYQVVIEYDAEEKFICRKKIIETVILKDQN
jgi:hypothetical protein